MHNLITFKWMWQDAEKRTAFKIPIYDYCRLSNHGLMNVQYTIFIMVKNRIFFGLWSVEFQLSVDTEKLRKKCFDWDKETVKIKQENMITNEAPRNESEPINCQLICTKQLWPLNSGNYNYISCIARSRNTVLK